VYGLQTMVTMMVCLVLWRIKRPEQLKGYPPGDLGRPPGLARAPEVKTVRRKQAQFAHEGEAWLPQLRAIAGTPMPITIAFSPIRVEIL